ncbi:acetyl xylan esterase AXE1 [Paenibacillus taihuensis]|uniref:Acetyl xylan esterase AXE1 n=1 Tax=Paenibacillus taihuensis TaxID=1156355 RepID=A0A3D9RQR2_9BACL|nr:prolyl oligopeptidase family serine peptidase [Paenibacillus taihuensis]REE78775.1 acetyl xylan esterase AXE1 [Paenibacillus taihuensis]
MSNRLAALPELLVNQVGENITSAEEWSSRRRPELIQLFEEHVYGRQPIGRPPGMTMHLEHQEACFSGTAIRKQIRIQSAAEHPEQGNIRLTLYLPAPATTTAIQQHPVFLLIDHGRLAVGSEDDWPNSQFWPVAQILARGYGTAVFQASDVDPDIHDEFRDGVHGLFDALSGPDQPRPGNAWGTIAAWAWGASRAMDYLQTDPDVDPNRVAVIGHSRGGKTALWAGALDERFAMVVSNESGCTGAAITRGKEGEDVHHINTVFPHWFCGNYKQYNHNEDELPVDQHMLLALIAPRLLYVASAAEDIWADPQSEYLSLQLAEPAYRLFGSDGLAAEPFPQIDSPITAQHCGYHVRAGGHDLTVTDWTYILAFADNRL